MDNIRDVETTKVGYMCVRNGPFLDEYKVRSRFFTIDLRWDI